MSWLISAGVFHIEETVLWSAFLWALGVFDLFRHFFPLPYESTDAPSAGEVYGE
jgi:hypothetical protein